MNHSLEALPKALSDDLHAALRRRWNSALFEVIVARLLQELGGVTARPEEREGERRPDFEVAFPDGKVIVEATAPRFDQEMARETRNHPELVQLIEEHAPPDWSVLLWDLPPLSAADSKAPLRHTLRSWFSDLPASGEVAHDTRLSFEDRIGGGSLRLDLIPGRYEERAVVAGPIQGGWDDSEDRIRRAVRNKRRQVRAVSDSPVLIAVNATGMSSTFEAFDRALLGRHCTQILLTGDGSFVEGEPYFEADGLLARGRGSPTIAGVIAFLNAGFSFREEPVLYLHPRFQLPLPRDVSTLAIRTLDRKRGTQEVPAGATLLPALGLPLR